jgi:hypothetical protein
MGRLAASCVTLFPESERVRIPDLLRASRELVRPGRAESTGFAHGWRRAVKDRPYPTVLEMSTGRQVR